MALAFVKEIGTVTETNTGSTSVITVPAGGVAQNNLIVGAAVHDSGVTVSSVTDTQGNSYTIGTTQGATGALGSRTTVFYAIATTALVSGNSITVTYSSSGFSARKAGALEWSGNATASYTDGENSSADTAFPRTAAMSSGNVATANAADLLVGIGCSENNGGYPSVTPTTSFSSRGSVTQGNNTQLFFEDRIVSSTGTYSSAPTLSSDQYWTCHVNAFKEAAAAGLGGPLIGGGKLMYGGRTAPALIGR